MAAHQSAVAELQTLIKDLPELLHVAAGGERHIRQVDRHHALVKAAVVLRLPLVIHVRGEEGAAAHAGVAVAFAVLILLQLQHDLFADVVRHHALRGALSGELREVPVGRILVNVLLLKHIDQLREGRRHPDTLLVLHALDTLTERLLDDHREIVAFLVVLRFAEVHEDRHKRRLAVRREERHHLVLNRLDAAADFVAQAVLDDLIELFLIRLETDRLHLRLHDLADLFARRLHKRGEVREADRLAAVLVRRDLGDDLRRDIAGGREAVRLLNQRTGDHGAVLQHVLEVHEVAVMHVLRVVVGVVEVNQAFLMRLHDVLREQDARRQVAGHFARHIVTLRAVDHRVFVGVFLLRFFVVTFDQ